MRRAGRELSLTPRPEQPFLLVPSHSPLPERVHEARALSARAATAAAGGGGGAPQPRFTFVGGSGGAGATPVAAAGMAAKQRAGLLFRLRQQSGTLGYLARGLRPLHPPPAERTVLFPVVDGGGAGGSGGFVDNTVVTSRYTAWNFAPVFLLQAFSRVANFYFLCIIVLQLIPSISITAGLPTTAIPLAFVLGFDALITAYEDYVRHRDDDRTNAKPYRVLRGGAFVRVPSRDIAVGDVLEVRREDEMPADCVMLAAVHEDPAQRGLCYVQTAQLDGETALKLRRAPEGVLERVPDEAAVAALRGRVVCEAPNPHFSRFAGVLFLDCGGGDDGGGSVGGDGSKEAPPAPDVTAGSPPPPAPPAAAGARGTPLEADNTLLRGCTVRNVDAVYGLVVYTGRETKVRVSQHARRTKTAGVEREITRWILWLVAFQLALCAGGAAGFAIWGAAASPGA
jgi:phospholipid-transporting ATPase